VRERKPTTAVHPEGAHTLWKLGTVYSFRDGGVRPRARRADAETRRFSNSLVCLTAIETGRIFLLETIYCPHFPLTRGAAGIEWMPSLYRRLFAYRERQNRSPLEDFLTEALADLLNRFPESVARSAVARLLCHRSDAVRELEGVWPLGTTVRWTTQRVIDGGRLVDLMMEVDGRPILIVENKISAGFQEHRPDPRSARGSDSQNQLATYGQWLAREADTDWGGAIVLLTHWTPAPPNFATDDQTYVSRYRTTVRWADFSRWLKGTIRSADQLMTDWVKLAGELVGFLKEQNMDSELATGHDWAALRIYVASADRVRNSVERIWEGARSIWRPVCQQTEIPLELSTEYGCVWKYRYLARSDLRNSYLAVGLRYPDLSEYLSDLAFDGGPYMFVELASEVDDAAIDGLAMPDGWLSTQSLWLAKRPLRDLPADADFLVVEAEAWVRERVGEVAKALA
jgi:hypothetical protein